MLTLTKKDAATARLIAQEARETAAIATRAGMDCVGLKAFAREADRLARDVEILLAAERNRPSA